MASITYRVTATELDSARLGTFQVFDFNNGILLNTFTRPKKQYKRFYLSSMDRKSGRGTKVNQGQTSTIRMSYPTAQLLFVDELLDSLADYQLATFDGSDIDFFSKSQQFKMMSDAVSFEEVGCIRFTTSFDVEWF